MTSLNRTEARRLAVIGAGLGGPAPPSVLAAVESLGRLQMDPVSAVARAEHLVLWSRLGAYDIAELDRLRWEEGSLFEYRAHIVPATDYAVHRETMRRFPRAETARGRYLGEWLAANAAFRRYVLRELRRRGPLLSRDLADRAVQPWRTGGWNDGKNVGQMLDALWQHGDIAIAGRQGNERIWDLAARVLPVEAPRLPAGEAARRLLSGQLRVLGIARIESFGYALDGRPPGWEPALRDLVAAGVAVPVTVEGLPGRWYAHADVLDAPFTGRTTLLSPFDPLITDRERVAQLFDFRYRLEMYVPKAKREYGYYVLPVLHGDALVGRIDPLLDRREGVLRIQSVHAEPGAGTEAGEPVRAAIDDLARWVGADTVEIVDVPASVWRSALPSGRR